MFKENSCRGFLQMLLVLALPAAACSSNNSNGYSNNTATGGSSSTGDASSQCKAAGTLTVTAEGTTAYMIDGAANPTLTLCKGEMYTFAVNASGHPFYIKTVQGPGTANAYSDGVTGNGTDSGNVTFDVPMSGPSTLYYDCSIHAPMTGVIHLM